MITSAFFYPKNLENRAAIRTAIATLIAVLIAFSLHLERPYWSGMTVVILANIYTGNVIDKAIMRLAGTLFGAATGYFLSGLIVNSFFLFLLTNFLLIAGSVYYYNFSRYAYAYLLFALSAFIVISELAISPEDAFWMAIWRPVEISLGVIVSSIAALFLFPNTVQDAMEKTISSLFNNLLDVLDNIKSFMAEGDNAVLMNIKSENLTLKKQVRKGMEMIGFMRREIGFSRDRLDEFRLIMDSLMSLSRLIRYYLANEFFINDSNRQQINQNAMAEYFTTLKQGLLVIENKMRDDRNKVSLQNMQILSNSFKRMFPKTAAANEKTLALAHFFRQLTMILQNMSTLTKKDHSIPAKVRAYHEQLRNDPDVIIHGLKAGLAAILSLGFWLTSNWPGGLNGIISSLVISIRRNLFEMGGISMHRILGCLLGGGLALGCLAYFSFNLYDFIVLMLCGVWMFSYFSFKLPDYAYIGLQANIALVITMAQEGGPPTTLEAPLERLGGIFIGITASFLVANGIWRTDLWQMFLRQIRKLKQQLVHNSQCILTHNAHLHYYDLSNLFWITRGLLETLEGRWANKPLKMAQLQVYHQEFANLVTLQATLAHIIETVDLSAAEITAQQCQIDLKRLAEKTANLSKELCGFTTLNKEIKSAIEKLMAHQENRKITPIAIENCEAYLLSLKQLIQIFEDFSKQRVEKDWQLAEAKNSLSL